MKTRRAFLTGWGSKWERFPLRGRHGFLAVGLFLAVVAVACAGEQGPPGAQGPQGSAGLEAVAGPAGPAGSQGPQGTSGTAGIQGPQGPAGTTGSRGPRGIAGAAGRMAPASLEGAMMMVFADSSTTHGTVTARPDKGEVNGANATLKTTAESIHSRVKTKGGTWAHLHHVVGNIRKRSQGDRLVGRWWGSWRRWPA